MNQKICFTTMLLTLSACASEESVKVYNNAPTVTITSHSGTVSLQDGYEVTFQAQVQDDNHAASALLVKWDSDTRSLCAEQAPTSDGTSQCRISLTEEESIVRVQVIDPEGSAAIQEITVEVNPTTAPTVSILSPMTQGIYYSDQLILFAAQVEDNEDSPSELTYEWESSIGGVLSTTATPNEDGLLEEYLYLSEGSHALTLTVTDQSGKSTERSISMVVGGSNTNPDCSITAPENGSSYVVGETIIFQATASDSEIETDDLSIKWISDKDGELGAGLIDSSGEVSFSFSELSANTHTIQFTVQDELESSCSDSIIISVATPPDITLLSPTNGAVVTAGELVLFDGTVEDGEDLPSNIDITWNSSIDGDFSTQGATSTGLLSVNTSALSTGLHSITVTATDTAGLTDAEVIGLRINTLPAQPTVSILPAEVYTNSNINVVAGNLVDDDGDSVQAFYEWFKNGSLTTFTSTTIQSSDTTKGEVWTVRVTPNDGYQDGSYSENTVEILNSSPDINSLSINAAQATTSASLTCTGSATDIDGDTITETYLWTNETTGTPIGSTASITLSPLSVSPGDSVGCAYTTSDGSDSSSQEQVIGIINSEPTIDSLSLVPSTPYLGDTVNCIGNVTDIDLETTTETYLWENQSTGATLATSSTLLLNTTNASPNDTVGCTLTVTDVSGGFATSTSTATVGNLPPSIDSLTFDVNSVAVGDTISCLSSESDPEGDIPSMTYTWTNETNGTQIGTGASLTVATSMATGFDEISCIATATDSYGASDTETISIFVDETAPSFTQEANITPNTGVTTNSTLSCTGSAVDPDGGSVGLSYSWNVGTTIIGTTQSITLSPSSVQPSDIVECIIIATDSAGEQTTSNTSVMVGNTAPTLSNLSISPSASVYTSTSLTCLVTVADIDNETLIPSYTWKNGASTIGTGDSITLTNTMAQPADNITCEVNVTDGYGASTTDSISVLVENTAPILSSVTITPTTAYNDSTLSCGVGATDGDNQTLTTTYEWNNTTVGSTLGTSASITLDSSMASHTDNISCTATIQDPSGGTATDITSITLQNRPPTTPTVQITPSTAYVDSELTCSISGGGDADNDTVSYSYSWSVNGGAPIATTEILNNGFLSGDTVECSVTPNDGLIDGTAGTISIGIGNTAPVVSSVTLTPDPAYTLNSLSAAATYSDLDNDTLTLSYTWNVGSTQVQTGTSEILASSFFSKGETVSVSVVAEDGVTTSVAQTQSIVVSNTPPTQASISLSPAVPVEQVDDLLCELSGASADDDSDTITYTFAWTVDGTPYTSAPSTSATSTVSASETIGGEEWICTITPNDGDADGSSTSASVIIDSSWSGPITFNNCGQTGDSGPSQSQCDSEYSGTDLEGDVTVSSGIQYWTVPGDGTYQIEVYGAAGGMYNSIGGRGAYLKSEIDLTLGEELKILVGQMGTESEPNSYSCGGGGGGTFVAYTDDTPIIVAGGGGGKTTSGTYSTNPGQTGTSGGFTYGNGNGYGINGEGGDNGTTNGDASGGGGFYSDGIVSTYSNCAIESVGKGFVHGGQGGVSNSGGGYFGGNGGFGGGSPGCHNSYCRGGGAGGYSGGQGGTWSGQYSGGGGGSYNSGNNSSSSGNNNGSHGMVIIEKL